MIHGLLLINKPPQMTSHTIVDMVRELFKIKKVGHFGTLDPLAEGLLLIGIGNATKFFDFYIKKRKIYSGSISFGFSTTTYDAEGEPTSPEFPIDLHTVDIETLLASFRGKQLQTPPIYSAKKFKGKPLYKYARENQEVEAKPVYIEIFSLTGHIITPNTLAFRAETSSGTYIRSLAHDMGQKIGVGAHLKELKRESVGEFHLDAAFTPQQLAERLKSDGVASVVTPIEALLPEFPKIIVNPSGKKSVLNGMPLLPRDVTKIINGHNGDQFRLFDDEGKLLAIAQKDAKLMRFKTMLVFSN